MNKSAFLAALVACIITSSTLASAQPNPVAPFSASQSRLIGMTDPAYQDILRLHDFGATEYVGGSVGGRGIGTRLGYAYFLKDLSPLILHPQTFRQQYFGGIFDFREIADGMLWIPIYFRPELVHSPGALAILASLYQDFTPELAQIGVDPKPILAQIETLRRNPPPIVVLPLTDPQSDHELAAFLPNIRAMGAFTAVSPNDRAYGYLVRLQKLGALDVPGMTGAYNAPHVMTRFEFAVAVARADPLIAKAQDNAFSLSPSTRGDFVSSNDYSEHSKATLFTSTWGNGSWQPALLHNAKALYLYSQLVQEFQPEVERLGVNLVPLTMHLASLAKAAPRNAPDQPFLAMDKSHWAKFSMWECRTAGVLVGEAGALGSLEPAPAFGHP